MPTSNLHVAPAVLYQIHEARQTLAATGRLSSPFTILDVGPGRGKYGHLIREYVDPEATVDAIEAWAPYITDFRLDCIYDNVRAGDALDLTTEELAPYHLVLLADVIEHLPRRPAFELLERISGYVVISTPRDFFLNPPDLPPTENHISHWAPADFADHPRFDTYDLDVFDRLAGLLVRLRPK